MKFFSHYKFLARFLLVSTALTLQTTFATSHLDKIEAFANKVSIGLLFDFKRPTPVQPSYKEETKTLSLFFPRIRAGELQAHKNWVQLKSLTHHGLTVDLEDQNEAPIGSTLRISFAQAAIQGTEGKQASLVVKWSNVEGIQWANARKGGCNRFTVDIFNATELAKLKESRSVLHATNDVIQNDFSSIPGLQKPSQRRIIIDAGHGGNDIGAQGCGNIQEKEIALKVSKILAKKLKTAGFQVHLTRNEDRNVGLVKRCSLAYQLKADAFISIHLNSAGKVSKKTSGIESYYLTQEGILPPSHVGGYYFVNTEHSKELIDSVNTHLKTKIDGSKALATCVQSQLMHTLQKNNLKTRDRGVKPEHLRLLLHNNVPTTLVEVGFVTNPAEAAMLQTESYQDLLATGMTRGIKQYFDQQ
jgi:N-acetylmuramoyl-L-alanine amidase